MPINSDNILNTRVSFFFFLENKRGSFIKKSTPMFVFSVFSADKVMFKANSLLEDKVC